jgi:hypothetical protein
MLKSPLFRFLLWKHDLSPQDPGQTNRKYLDDLLNELRASRLVRQAVLLGMDGVYDEAGRLDRSQTEFLVANDYVFHTVRAHPDCFLAGPSINPQRRDAVEEVHRCAEAGAVLVKILPNTQSFNPANRQYRPFYRALAERNLPLLSHVGYELSLTSRDQSLGDPDRLRTALDEGVTVIAAHACSYGLMVYERFFPTFRMLCATYPNFYADISSLTQPHRLKMLLLLRRHPDLHDRLLFGTDYPLSVFHMAAWGRVDLHTLSNLIRTKNRFDRQALVCRELGIGFHSIEEILPQSARKVSGEWQWPLL